MANKDDVVWWSKGRTTSGVNVDSDTRLLHKFLPDIAKNLSSIKMSLLSLVKTQELDKKNQYFEKQRQRASDYSKRYKKIKPTKEEKKAVTEDKKSLLDTVRDGIVGIFKFILLGLAAMGISKLLSLPGVMDGIKTFFKDFIVALADIIKKGVSFLTDLIQDVEVTNSLTKLFKDLFHFIAEGISKAADIFSNILTDPENKGSIVKVITSIIGVVFNGLIATLDVIGSTLGTNEASIREGIIKLLVMIANGIAGSLKFTENLLSDENFRKAISKIYVAFKEFFSRILNEPFSVPILGEVSLKQVFIATGAALVGFQIALAALTGAMVGRAAARGVTGGGGLPGTGGTVGGGKAGTFGKIVGQAGNLLMGAAAVVGIKEWVDASKATDKRKEELKSQGQAPIGSPQPKTPAQAAATNMLQSKMKQGDVVSELHEPGTDILAQKIPSLVSNFGVFTAFDDKFHNEKHPGSKHAEGLALDFTVNGGKAAYAQAAEAIRKHLLDSGLNYSDFYVKDEANNPGKSTTGDHVHVQFKSKEAAEKYRAKYPTMTASAFAREPGTAAALTPEQVSAASPPSNVPTRAPTETPPIADKPKPSPTFGDTLVSMFSEGETGDFFRKIDEMTGGKLGIASGELASVIRTRGLFDITPDMVDGSTNITTSQYAESVGPIPSVYDDTLIKKLIAA